MKIFDELLKEYMLLVDPADLHQVVYENSKGLPWPVVCTLMTGIIGGVFRDYEDDGVEEFCKLINKSMDFCRKAVKETKGGA